MPRRNPKLPGGFIVYNVDVFFSSNKYKWMLVRECTGTPSRYQERSVGPPSLALRFVHDLRLASFEIDGCFLKDTAPSYLLGVQSRLGTVRKVVVTTTFGASVSPSFITSVANGNVLKVLNELSSPLSAYLELSIVALRRSHLLLE